MSLIEEALRKQREETDRAQQTQPAQSPPLTLQPVREEPPPPLPDPAQEPDAAPENSRRTWRTLAGVVAIVAIIVILLLSLVGFGLYLFRRPAAAPVATTAVPRKGPAASPAPTNTPAPAVPPVAVTTAAPAIVAAVPAATSAPPAAPVAVATAVPPPVVAAPAPVAAATTTPPPAAVAALPAAPAVAATNIVTAEPPKTLVIWPRLAVSGFMGGGRGGRGAVIINNQMMSVGESIEGAKVLAVDKRGVTLSFGGEVRTLAVGSSTE